MPIVGLTATPERGDGAGLAPLFNGLVVGASVGELVSAGHLVSCDVLRPTRVLKNGQIAQDPLAAYREHGQDGARPRQAILFARTVEEAEGYAASFSSAGFRAECITAMTRPDVREMALEAFRRGLVRVICNVYVLTEGTDLPNAEVCILARGAGTAGIFVQMVGRVLRPHPGKREALLLDLRGVTHVHGRPEDERSYALEGRGITVAAASVCAVCSAPLGGGYPCAECGYTPTQTEAAKTEVTGDPLVKFARMREQGDDERARVLRRWVKNALDKGHKPTSVRYKWRAVYGEDLSMSALMSCVQEVRNVQSVNAE